MSLSQKKLLEILEVSRKAFEHTLEKPDVIEKVKNYGFDADSPGDHWKKKGRRMEG